MRNTLTELTKKQIEVLNSPKSRLNLYEGAVRTGKTVLSLLEWNLFVPTAPDGAELFMVGRTITTLEQNCLGVLQRLEPSFSYSIAKQEATLHGKLIRLKGADNKQSESKIRGSTAYGFYLDELTELDYKFFKQSQARCSVKGARIYATTNPDSASHWVRQEIILNTEINRSVFSFTIDDNEFLDPVYVEEIKKEYTGVYYDRNILGLWVNAEGVIYPDFANNTKKFLKKSIDKKDIYVVLVGIDYGASKSSSTYRAVAILHDLSVVVIEEMSFGGKKEPNFKLSPRIFCEKFHAFYDLVVGKYGRIDHTFADWGALGMVLTNGLIEYCDEHNLDANIENCKKGEIIDRIKLIGLLMGTGRFFMLEHCTVTIEAFVHAIWEEGKKDVRLDDGSVDVDSQDAVEYAFFPFRGELIGG